MKRLIIVTVVLLVAVAAVFLWLNFKTSGQSPVTNSVVTPAVVVPSAKVMPQEYYDSVNAKITLEQLQKSKIVRDVQTLNAGSPAEETTVFIFKSEVTAIDGRILTLAKEGDTLRIFIGQVAKVYTVQKGAEAKPGKFEELKIGELVSMGGFLQKGSPLAIIDLYIFK